MGNGSFRVEQEALPDGTQAEIGVFTVIAVADYPIFGQVDEFQWQRVLTDLNQGIYQASQGRIRIEVFLSDESWGLGQAEFVLHQIAESPAYATNGQFGRFGEAVHLFDWAAATRHTVVHEFGHHAWGLGDEYTAPLLSDDIDDTAPADPTNTVIPLSDPGNDPAEVVNSSAVLRFGVILGRRTVTAYDPDAATVTVAPAFSADPRTAEPKVVWFQRTIGVGCSEDPTARFCLMESFFPGATPKFDFCIAGPDNHDPDGDTAHTERHPGESCWDVIQRVMAERFDHTLAAPEELVATPAVPPELEFFSLEKEARVVLAMDRSGSMGTDNKIQGARYGAEFWLRSLAQSDTDWLSLLWYNEAITVQLGLGQYSLPQDVDDAIDEMNVVSPGGNTNIRDALYEALNQIQSRNNRAALQAVVLLTDGIHNRPEGSAAEEVIPDFQADGTQIICVALGGPENIDFAVLEQLATETGGTVIRVESGVPDFVGRLYIQVGLAWAEGVLRNGNVRDGEVNVAPVPKEVTALGDVSQPPFEKFLEAMGFRSLEELLKAKPASIAVVPFLVEDGAQKAKFSSFYTPEQNLWTYLVAPDGTPVDFATPGNVLIRPASPFTSALVKAPKAGRWRAIVTGAVGAVPVDARYLAMVENRNVVVAGGCRPEVALGEVVDFWCSATYRDRLSGLNVTAEIVAPNGVSHSINLTDADADDPRSGNYRGFFVPDVQGPHRYRTRIVSKGNTSRAGAMHRLLHSDPKGDKGTSLDTEAPAFVRLIPGYFDVGKRPVPKDVDPRYEGPPRRPVRRRKNKLIPRPSGEAREKSEFKAKK